MKHSMVDGSALMPTFTPTGKVPFTPGINMVVDRPRAVRLASPNGAEPSYRA